MKFSFAFLSMLLITRGFISLRMYQSTRQTTGRQAGVQMKQPMETGEMLKCFALFYQRPRHEDWTWLERQGTWLRFTDTIRYFLVGRVPSKRAQAPSGTSLEAPSGASLGTPSGTSLDASLDRLVARPPTCAEHQHFEGRHYVGGLPVSVLPVESLYRRWTTQKSASLPFAHQTGLYGGDPAAHMASLLEKFELAPAASVALPPDHLAIELELLGLLSRYGSTADLCQFIDDHLSWIPNYVDALLDRAPEARVYLAITALLVACLEALRLQAWEKSQRTA
jgi:hypothetical protein